MNNYTPEHGISKFHIPTENIIDVKTSLKYGEDNIPYIEMQFVYTDTTLKIHKIPIELIQGEITDCGKHKSGILNLSFKGDKDNILYTINIEED